MPKLTTAKVRTAGPGRYADGGGLYLLVKPSGARTWVLRVQVNGRRRDFGLGSVDLSAGADEEGPINGVPISQRRILTLKLARAKAAEGLALAKAGRDPSAEWRKVKKTTPTFEAVARAYYEAIKGGWKNGKHRWQWISSLEKYVFPTMGGKLVNEIDASTVQDLLAPIWTQVPETARRLRQRIFAVLDHAHGKGWRQDEAPVRAVNRFLSAIKQPKRKNFPALPYGQLPALVARVKEQDRTVGRLALLLTLYTVVRQGAVRLATWDQFDLADARWDVPADTMKGEEAITVPLPSSVVTLLEEIKELGLGRPGDLVFPGKGGKALSDATITKAFRAAGGGHHTVHGTSRSSFRDWVAEQTSFPPAWAEAALAHKLKDKTEAAYLRTKYLNQRRGLMQAWAGYLDNGSNVVALSERRA
jgi:integrase